MEAQFNEVSAQENAIVRAIIESKNVLEAIKNIKIQKSGQGSDVLFPLGAGVFARSETPRKDKIVVSVGANVVVEKTLDQGLEFIEERVKELEKAVSSIQSHRFELENKIKAGRNILSNVVQQQQVTPPGQDPMQKKG